MRPELPIEHMVLYKHDSLRDKSDLLIILHYYNINTNAFWFEQHWYW